MFTRMSNRLKSSSMRPTAAWIDSGRVTSSRTWRTSRPSAWRRSQAASPLTSSRAPISTIFVFAASCRLISNPMPLLAPVTRAIRFSDWCMVQTFLWFLELDRSAPIPAGYALAGSPRGRGLSASGGAAVDHRVSEEGMSADPSQAARPTPEKEPWRFALCLEENIRDPTGVSTELSRRNVCRHPRQVPSKAYRNERFSGKPQQCLGGGDAR